METHRTCAEDLARRASDAGHSAVLVCRDSATELRTLSHFIGLHSAQDTGARIFLIAAAAHGV